jgi:hypothetical protein
MYRPNEMSDFCTLLSSHILSTHLCHTFWYYFFPLIFPQISFPKHASSLILQSSNLLLSFITMSLSPSPASTIHPDTLGLPPEILGPPLQGLADEQEPLMELRQSSLPVSTLVSRAADEVLPPLKKGASTYNSTALQAIFPVLASTLVSWLAGEVLPPLKKGASTNHSTGLKAIFPVPASTLQIRPVGEVLPPLKKGASTDHCTGI